MSAFNDEIIKTAPNIDAKFLFCVQELNPVFGGCALHRDVNDTSAYMMIV